MSEATARVGLGLVAAIGGFDARPRDGAAALRADRTGDGRLGALRVGARGEQQRAREGAEDGEQAGQTRQRHANSEGVEGRTAAWLPRAMEICSAVHTFGDT